MIELYDIRLSLETRAEFVSKIIFILIYLIFQNLRIITLFFQYRIGQYQVFHIIEYPSMSFLDIGNLLV